MNVHNYGSSQVEVGQRRTASGGTQIDIVVDRLVAKNLAKPGSESQRAMRSIYGAPPGLIGR